MYDAMFLFAKALDDSIQAHDLTVPELNCATGKAWQAGDGLQNFIKLVSQPVYFLPILFVVYLFKNNSQLKF